MCLWWPGQGWNQSIIGLKLKVIQVKLKLKDDSSSMLHNNETCYTVLRASCAVRDGCYYIKYLSPFVLILSFILFKYKKTKVNQARKIYIHSSTYTLNLFLSFIKRKSWISISDSITKESMRHVGTMENHQTIWWWWCNNNIHKILKLWGGSWKPSPPSPRPLQC